MRKYLFGILLFAIVSPAFAQDSISLGVTKLGQKDYFPILNDIWGYADGNGNEYALVGLTNGFSIVDVTVPSNPVEEHFIQGVNSTWRDVKTWSHYAYVVHDMPSGTNNSDGILIVDMNTVEASNLITHNVYPDIPINDTIETYHNTHNIYIDENGVLYLFGSNFGVGGAQMFDLTADPTNPAYLGSVNSVYYHDGVARGDTLWGAAITTGVFQVVDVSDKSNPVLLGSHSTPNNFTHNIWFSDDNQTVFTTDEKKGAFIASYDVSDMSNITELDRIRTGVYDGRSVIPHNVHVKGDFLVTSYYTSGLQIVDASQPDILVETAYYDTSPLEGDGFNGAWGAYPYLPSGNILVSDRQEGLFVLATDYPRATYVTVHVGDTTTGSSIVNAQIEVLNTDMSGQSNIFGNFRDGQRDTGTYQLAVSKPGYVSDTVSINLREGLISAKTVYLKPIGFSLGEQAFLNGLEVFPNPTNGSINLRLPELEGPSIEIVLSNLKGQEVFRRESDSEKQIHLQANLEPGVYILRVKNGSSEFAPQKVVVRP